MVVVWLRVDPTAPVLGVRFGVGHPTVVRTIARVRPLLERAGRDTLRRPGHGQPGRRRRRPLPALLAAVPELAVLVDTFEQRVQRPRDRAAADRSSSGTQQPHPRKTQLATARPTGGASLSPPASAARPTTWPG